MGAGSVQTDVVIVGGGPVGLAAAIGLRHHGIACVVIEQHRAALDFPKGRAVNARTMEIMRQWGLEEPLRSVGLPAEATSYGYLGATLLAETFTRLAFVEPLEREVSPCARLICAQEQVEIVLRRAAEDAGADVRFGHRLVGLRQDERRVEAEVRVEADGSTVTVEAAYAIAADGARSAVRAQLGIGFDGPGAIGDSISILVEAPLGDRIEDRRSVLYGVADPPGAGFAVVDNDRRWLLMMRRDPATDPDESFTEERCVALVRTAIGDDEVPVTYRAHRFWQPTARWARQMAQGRIFLVGDAAHSTTPAGALGMTGGIADAHNLAWKLAAVIDGTASPSLLDTYDVERRPMAQRAAEASMAIGASVRDPHARRGALGVSLGAVYASSAVHPDGTPAPEVDDPIHDYVPSGRPGGRAPHMDLPDGTSLLDRFGRGWVVLVDAAGGGAMPDGGAGELEVCAMEDPAWRARYGVEGSGAVLVRPDGFIAFRARRCADPVGAARGAMAAILGAGGDG